MNLSLIVLPTQEVVGFFFFSLLCFACCIVSHVLLLLYHQAHTKITDAAPQNVSCSYCIVCNPNTDLHTQMRYLQACQINRQVWSCFYGFFLWLVCLFVHVVTRELPKHKTPTIKISRATKQKAYEYLFSHCHFHITD